MPRVSLNSIISSVAICTLSSLASAGSLSTLSNAALIAPVVSTAPLFRNQDPSLQFPNRVTAWLDRTQVLPFHLSEEADEDLEFNCEVTDPDILQVIDPPRVLKGHKVGYLRVRALALGTTHFNTEGVIVHVSVKEPEKSARVNTPHLYMTTPVHDARIWGQVSFGVSFDPGRWHDAVPEDVKLIGPDGLSIEPISITSDSRSSVHHLSFLMNTEELPEGPHHFIAQANYQGDTIESPPIRANVISTRLISSHLISSGDSMVGECEDFVFTKRSENSDDDYPRVGSSESASNGQFVQNGRPEPPFAFPLSVSREGHYQLMLTCRGDFGVGGFPSLGICIDDPRVPQTTGRIVSHRWQRIPIGFPVFIDAGEHLMTLRYLNDQSITNANNRNLFLDRFEFLRIETNSSHESTHSKVTSHGTDSPFVGSIESDSQSSRETLADQSPGSPPIQTDQRGSGFDNVGLWIGFDHAWDFLPINGTVTIKGFCRWNLSSKTGTRDSPCVPQVEILLNGRAHSVQTAAQPVFKLDRSEFQLGSNTVQLIARLEDGQVSRTHIQTLMVLGEPSIEEPRQSHRFSNLDKRWIFPDSIELTDEGQEPGHRIARISQTSTLSIPLPENLDGLYEISMEARGNKRKSPIVFRVDEVPRDGVTLNTTIPNYWDDHSVGTLQLPSGQKHLYVEIQGSDSERPIEFRALGLRRSRESPDRSPPYAEIIYPKPFDIVSDTDMVIVHSFDDDRVLLADVLIDGEPQSRFAHIPKGAGYLTIPLVTDHSDDESHEISVRVVDSSGNTGDSQSLVVHRSKSSNAPSRYTRAVHLLNRLGYGPDPRSLADVLILGEREWLERSLRGPCMGDLSALELAVAQRGTDFAYNTNRSVLTHALRTPNPLRLRLSLFIENHFSTWVGKTGSAGEWGEHLSFLQLGPAPFLELLTASATSPIMLSYLDQQGSYASRLNENYAREIMELHTLGVHGGYTQSEVTSLAGILAGLTMVQESPPTGLGTYMIRSFCFDPGLSDSRERDILGLRFENSSRANRFDRFRKALELLASHPSTARHISSKWVRYFIAENPEEEWIEDFSQIFVESGGDMSEMVRALYDHPAFWNQMESPRLSTPQDFAIRLARACETPQVDYAIGRYLSDSAMGFFDCVTPDGYPLEEESWMDSNGIMQRWKFAERISWATKRLTPNALKSPPAGDPVEWAQRLIDNAAIRLTGSRLGHASNLAALDYLLSDSLAESRHRIDSLAVMICRLPEASLR